MKAKNEKKQLDEIREKATEILKKECSENSYYTYSIWEKNNMRRAYFAGYESGHGMNGDKEKQLRRTGFFVDLVQKKIVSHELYSKLSAILNIACDF